MKTRSHRPRVPLMTRMMGMVTGPQRRELYGEPYLMSQDEVSHLLAISRTTIWRLLKEGELESVGIGSRTFISKVSIDQFLARHSSGRPE